MRNLRLLATLAVIGCGTPDDGSADAVSGLAVECDPSECDGTEGRCVATTIDLLLPEAACFDPDYEGCWERTTCEIGERFGTVQRDEDTYTYRVRGCTNARTTLVDLLQEIPAPEGPPLETDCEVVVSEALEFCGRFDANECPPQCALRPTCELVFDPETGCEVSQWTERGACTAGPLPGDPRDFGFAATGCDLRICPPSVDLH
ncbi:MAG: hypothetical protein WBG86_08505 [Polyangiales bacterium]